MNSPINTPKYQMVSSKAHLRSILQGCKDLHTALDFETTSLAPADGRVRLVSLRNRYINALVDFDQIKGGFRNVAGMFAPHKWIVFNAGFERRWFQDAGVYPHCLDVATLKKVIVGGGHFGLKLMVQKDLGLKMSKEEQVSDWGAKVLTHSQLDYAFLDAELTWKLWQHWLAKSDTDHSRAFHIFNDMVPAVIEMETAGMLLNKANHKRLISRWTKLKLEKEAALFEYITTADVGNIRSDTQWSSYFSRIFPDNFISGWPRTDKTGQLSMKGEVLEYIASQVPNTPLSGCLDALRAYKTIAKYLSSFGETLLTKASMSKDKRIHARFNIGAAKTLRFSCSGPNLQQIPRDRELLGTTTSVRSSFMAARGHRLVSLDYSGIELRVLALLSGDDQLLHDVVHGDVHAEVASVIAGRKINAKTKAGKALRQAAKGVSFGIIYGSGAAGLANTMGATPKAAASYIDMWQQRYPDAFGLRHTIMKEVAETSRMRMIDGGTITMVRYGPKGKILPNPDLPKCSNYPVQRAAMSIMARAITRHKNSLDAARRNGKQQQTLMLSTIHDALIDEAALRDAKRCLIIMEEDMTAAYLDIFPSAPTDRLVEGGIGPNWAELD